MLYRRSCLIDFELHRKKLEITLKMPEIILPVTKSKHRF